MLNDIRALFGASQYNFQRPSLKPIFVVDRMLGRDAAIATFDRVPVVIFEIDVFEGTSGWIEELVTALQTAVHAIITTGPPNVHGQAGPAGKFNLVCIEIPHDADLDALLDRARLLLAGHGVRILPIDQDVFSTQAAHGWHYAHFFAIRLKRPTDIGSAMAASDRITAPAYTLHVRVARGPQRGRYKMSADLFAYSPNLMQISALDVSLPRSTSNDFLQGLAYLGNGKMPFSALFVRRPLMFEHRV